MLDRELYLLVDYYPVEDIDQTVGTSDELRALIASVGRTPDPERAFGLIRYGVACLRAFVQLNFLGPADTNAIGLKMPKDLNDGWAREQLALGGDPAYPLCNEPIYLAMAKWILIDEGQNWRTVAPSVSWWACRTCWIWQQLFVDRRPELRDILYNQFKFLDDYIPDGQFPKEVKASYAVEKARVHEFYFEQEKAEVALREALALAELSSIHLTGILGRRTKFQMKNVAQLSLEDLEYGERSEGDQIGASVEYPVDCSLNDDTVLDTAQFSSAVTRRAFSPIQECVLVTFVENLQRSHFSGDILLNEIEKAYLDRLLHHPISYVCKFICLFRRCQLECNDFRRIERALSQAEHLVKEFETQRDSLQPRDKFKCFFTVGMPPIWDAKKMQCGLLTKLGCTSEALRVFLDLQMWEQVVECYQKLGMLERAETIIKEQLDVKETPHLLCVLGDIRNEECWYQRAWELSGKRLARARASLGMFYFVRKNYEQAVAAFEAALALLPLDLKSWYSLGYCAMQIKNYQRAAQAYHRCVTIDADSFEAWNNLAACYVHLGDKYRAFQVLNESIKCNYENWKVWENHVHMGVDTGHFRESLTGINRLIDLKGKYDDTRVLGILVRVATKKSTQENIDDTDIDENFHRDLCALFGRLTAKLVNNATVWRLYSDLKRPMDEDNCDEWERYVNVLQKAHQTAVKSVGWEKDGKEVEEIVEYCLRLAEAQMKLASLLESSSSSSMRPKQLTASTRLMLKGVLANLNNVEEKKEEYEKYLVSLKGLLETIDNT